MTKLKVTFRRYVNRFNHWRACVRYRHLVKHGYITMRSEPLKCTKCKSTSMKTDTVDTVGGYPCEVKYLCSDCGEHLGYWAYGHFQPLFV